MNDSGSFLFALLKTQILRNLAKQEDINDSDRQNAGDLIIDLEESIKFMSSGIKAIIFDKNMNVKRIEFHKNIKDFDAREFLFILMRAQLLRNIVKDDKDIKNPELINVENLLVDLDKSIRRMNPNIKAIILDKDLSVKKTIFAAPAAHYIKEAPAPEMPYTLADAPVPEIKPKVKEEIKKPKMKELERDEWNKFVEKWEALNKPDIERQRRKEMLLSG